VTHYGVDLYRDATPLLDKLAALDMFVDIQVEREQLMPLLPLLDASGVRILVDHCGRPTMAPASTNAGSDACCGSAQPGGVRQAVGLCEVLAHARAAPDAWPFVSALVDAFTLERCLWASDWPYLRAPVRQDYGALLQVVPAFFSNASDRRKLLWDTPASCSDSDRPKGSEPCSTGTY
jgi:predicted TIM-barrel fold metal-dependent hydrolase